MLMMGKVKDPRLIGFITILRVEINKDLSLAKIFTSVMGTEEERQKTMIGLKSSAGMIRSVIGKQIRIKILPELRFVLDDSIDYSDRISRLLKGTTGAEPEKK